MDRISYLPQPILHDILSRLPDKDAARTSVLSKAWQDTWSTFPFLVFDESRYEMTKIPNDAENLLPKLRFFLDKYKFCNLVCSTLGRFLCKGLAIRKFKLVFKSHTPPGLLSLVDHWMKLACKSGVEVLQLENLRYSDKYDEFACLPLSVLEAKSLIKLELSWDFRIDQAFLNHPIKFSSLQVLSLSHVHLGDEQVIQNLISSCPLIEKIKLVDCSGLKSVSIHGLPKLKIVMIIGIEEVDVDAPSLEDLFYDVSGFSVPSLPCKINMDKCRNLRELCLVHVSSIIITNQWFLELFQKFPLLEKLILEGLYISERIKISSIQLKVLNLCSCYNIKEVEIDAPYLYKCTYHGDGSIMPVISILNSSRQLVLDVVFYVDFLLDLEKLREFLQNIKPNHIPVSLFLGFGDDSTVEINPFALQENPMAPPSIKHLTVCVLSDTEVWCLPLVTALFWSCRPAIISFNVASSKTLVKIFCEKLIGGKEDDCCCSSSQIKRWWHFLKDVKVSSSFRKHSAVVDFKTLLEALPTLSSEEEEEIGPFLEGDINFMLEWQ